MLRTLREMRLERGFSIRELEKRSGVTRGVISQLERGRLIATAGETEALAIALGLSVGSLATRTVLAYEAAA